MLVDKLRVRIATKQHAKIVEPRHDTLQLHAVDEKDGDGGLVLANMIEKDVLNVLGPVCGHCSYPCSCFCHDPSLTGACGEPVADALCHTAPRRSPPPRSKDRISGG